MAMNKKRIRPSDIVIFVILLLVALYVIAPIFLMLMTSLKTNMQFMKRLRWKI